MNIVFRNCLSMVFWMVGIIAFMPTIHAYASDDSAPQLVSGFSPMIWEMTEKDIRKVFSQYEIKKSEYKYSLVDENGNQVPATSKGYTVSQYPVFGGLSTGEVTFSSRGPSKRKVYGIEIIPNFDWGGCDIFMSDEEFAANKHCQKLLKEYTTLRKGIYRWLQKNIPAKSRKQDASEREDPRVGHGETWEWKYNGLLYLFDWGEELGSRYALSLTVYKLE